MNFSNKNIIIQMSLHISSPTKQYFYNSVSRFACYFASFCGTWRFIVSFIHFNPLSFERIISYGSNTSFISQIYFLLQVWKRRKFKIQHLCGQFLVQHKKCWFTLENWGGGILNTIFEKVHYISIQKSYCKLITSQEANNGYQAAKNGNAKQLSRALSDYLSISNLTRPGVSER